jgi:hypothetical protein
MTEYKLLKVNLDPNSSLSNPYLDDVANLINDVVNSKEGWEYVDLKTNNAGVPRIIIFSRKHDDL